MPQDFLQWLITVLIILLFAEKYVPMLLSKMFGIKINSKNENGDDKRICDLQEHAKVANEEMGQVKERLTTIETKLEILMHHFNL